MFLNLIILSDPPRNVFPNALVLGADTFEDVISDVSFRIKRNNNKKEPLHCRILMRRAPLNPISSFLSPRLDVSF